MNKYSEQYIAQVLSLYESGLSSIQIKDKLGLTQSYKALGELIKRNGAKMRTPSDYVRTPVPIEEVERLRSLGHTTKEISALLSISETTLHRAGIADLSLNPNSIAKYKKDLKFFNQIDSQLKAYYLGFLLADGSVDKRGNLKLEIQEQDGYILRPLRDAICSSIPITRTERVKPYKEVDRLLTTESVSFKSKEYLLDLEKWNIVPRKTYKDISLPNVNSDLMNHLIRGYFDGNGCISISSVGRRAVSFVGGHRILEDIEHHLKQEGVLLTKGITKARSNSKCSAFHFTSKLDIENFGSYIYKDAQYYLTRKRDKF